MIIRAHQMDSHVDFTLTQNLNNANIDININEYDYIIKESLREIFDAVPNGIPGYPKFLPIEDEIFASSIPFIVGDGEAIIYHDEDDNIISKITNIIPISFKDTLLTRIVCFGKDTFADYKHFFIYRSSYVDDSGKSIPKISIFLDKDFLNSRNLEEATEIFLIGEFIENLLYGCVYKDAVTVNERNHKLDPYMEVNGTYHTQYNSTGTIVVPDIMSPDTLKFVANHIVSLIWYMLLYCNTKMVTNYLCSDEWLICTDDLKLIVNKTSNMINKNGTLQENNEWKAQLVVYLAKRILKEDFETWRNYEGV